MKKSMALVVCAASLLVYTAPTYAQDTQPVKALELQVSRQGDIELACGSLSQEAMTMRDIINATQDIKNDSEMKSHGITAAGAVGSFLIGTVTGGIGLAAAGLLLETNVEGQSDEADAIQDVAEQRRSLMMGIYNAKGCYGPIEHAMQNPEQFDILQLAAVETAAGEDDEDGPEKPRYNQ